MLSSILHTLYRDIFRYWILFFDKSKQKKVLYLPYRTVYVTTVLYIAGSYSTVCGQKRISFTVPDRKIEITDN